MKKLHLLKSALLLCALIVGSGSLWATDVLTLDCATPAPTGTTSTSLSQSDVATFLNSAAGLSEAVNKITCSAKSGDVYKGKGSGGGGIPQQCLKVGKASGGGSFTFTIPNTYDEIGSVEITCYGWNTTSSISINGGTAQTFTTKQVEVTKTFDLASATRTIAIAVTTSAVCITEIVLKSAETGEATTVTIDDSGITNTDVASGTAAGSLSAVVKDASSNTIAAAAVTWTSSKPAVATINETTGAVTLVKKGSTTITASYAGVDGTYQSSSDTYELTVTNSDANDGTAAHPFTPTEARDALDASEIDSETDYYVRGVIAKIGTFADATGQLTYWISDDGSMTNNVQCYKGLNEGGAAFAAATDLEVGNFATVKGKLKIYNVTTYELDENNEVVAITPRTKVNIATFTATTNPLVLGETTTTTTTVTNDQVGWTPVSYTYESDDTDVATVDENGEITAVAKGTANITVTPVVSATDPTYKVGESKSLEITVSNPSHTASFSINGVIDNNDNDTVEEGEDITFPTDPADISGKSFVGWKASSAIVGTTEEEPTLVTAATMGNANITYYAVFAKVTTGTVTKTDNITLTTTGVSGNSYSSWTNKQATGGSNAVYAGCNAGGNDAIQLNASTNTSKRGIISTTTGGKLKKITVEWNSNSNDARSLVVYGSNTAYESVSGFNTSKGSELGSILKSSGTELTISGDYTYVGLYATEAIYLDKISIDWETTGNVYSGYCTTVHAEPSDPEVDGSGNVELTTTANMAGWRTYNNNTSNKYTVDGTTKVYYASATGESKVTLTEIAGGVPANMVVILHQSSGTTITLTKDNDAVISGAPADPSDNELKVSTANENLGTVYRLGYKAAYGVGFYQYTSASAPAGVIYVASVSSANFLGLDFGEGETTSVKQIETAKQNVGEYFNLAGQRVANPTKGLYIVNGRKVVIR